jgi:Holliday junction resolvase
MIQNAKKKGRVNEAKSIRLLEAAGYECVRAAGSFGVFDIVGISKTDIVLVQVKSNRNAGPAEIEAIQLFPAPPNARKLLHRWNDRQRLPEVKEL